MSAESGLNPVATATSPAVGTAKANLGSEKEELEAQEYYHGFRPRQDVQPLLTEVGDFLVRTSSTKDRLIIAMTVRVAPKQPKKNSKEKKGVEDEKMTAIEKKDSGRDGKKTEKRSGRDRKDHEDGVKNLLIKSIDNRWSVQTLNCNKRPPSFPTIFELVEHYKYNAIWDKVRLNRAIPKPNWYIKHDTVSFNKKDMLGSGNFCDVYKGLYQKTQQEKITVAVKVWHEKSKAEMEEDEQTRKSKGEEAKDSKAARDSMISEAQIMSYYKHRHIIHLFGVCCDHLPVLIVMEYCAGGNLENHLRKQGPKISTAERLLYCFEAATGMRYLHSKNCIHRDLAARNCLISNAGFIKITDFGLSQMMPEEMKPEAALDQLNEANPPKHVAKQPEAEMKAQVPIRWMAPESLRKEDRTYSAKTDVWSYGVLCYEIFNNGEKPWPDEDGWSYEERRIHMKKIATWIRRAEMPAMPTTTPPGLKEFVEKKIWAKEPIERPQMAGVCQAVHLIFSEAQLPPAAELTVNTLGEVKRRNECLDDSIEASPDETGDDVTGFGKDAVSARRASSNRNMRSAGTPKDAPTKLVTQETKEVSHLERNRKKTSARQLPQGVRRNAMAVPVVEEEEKKVPEEKRVPERKKTARPKNRKDTAEEKSGRRGGDRHRKKLAAAPPKKTKSVRPGRKKEKQPLSTTDDLVTPR